MAEIKFRCPECTQKIAVEASAAGVKIDCPTCHSRLVIPNSETGPVEVLVRRNLAIVGGSSDAVYAELQKAQAKAEKAVEELNQLSEKHTSALQDGRRKRRRSPPRTRHSKTRRQRCVRCATILRP